MLLSIPAPESRVSLTLDVLRPPLPNCLLDKQQLRNRYFALRHGEAESNCREVLCSSVENDRGLTPRGRLQIEDGGRRLIGSIGEPSPEVIHILSSPLPRAVQSAQVLHETLGRKGMAGRLRCRPELREREYGALEGQAAVYWEKLRLADAHSHDDVPYGAESARRIFDRLNAIIQELEEHSSGQIYVFVSHCDPIQVLQTLFARTLSGHYSDRGWIMNGEMCELSLSLAQRG